ncbi:hypothetical protein EAH84_09395 [Sphingomonas oligophenolica]|uniref:Preprotein translocase subunit YajC n=1 Tax=Sphingomonas oligophenolica TaxID=301154 RepID=A0A502CIN5_9SPHN|nr:hypothetical protein EAH84_09395 [Sphingomonas oligophenolica]
MSATPAAAQGRRVTVVPYVEVGQSIFADLNRGDVLTYSTVAVGADVSANTNRVSAQLSYRYERQISWRDNVGDQDINSGIAQVAFKATPALTLAAGGIATRSRADIRGAAPGNVLGNVDNISQVYAIYAGPTLATHAGPVAIGASYQLGYTKVDTPNGGTGVAPGQPRLDYYDDSISQTATVSAGVAPGAIAPVGLTASAGYDRDDAGQLKQRYEGYHARGDVLLPVSPYVAVTAGVGYERIETSEKSPVLTAAGAPALDANGRYITNDASPRQITYRTDGVYYDAGVVWRPNPRVNAEAHVGKRYGSVSYTGALSYQASKSVGVAARVYDEVTTFGQQLRTGLSNLPTSFIAARDSYTQQYNGCVFGTTGAAPGGCLNDVFQSISTASYRARGVDAILTASRGRSTFGAGAGYANRRLYGDNTTPGVTLYTIEDQSYYGQLFASRTLTPVSQIDGNLFVDYYDPGILGSGGVWSYGASANYGHAFGRLSTNAGLGVYSFKAAEVDAVWSAQAQLAARYSF